MDTKTLIGILFWGNLAFFSVTFAFLRSYVHVSELPLLKRFLFSKLLQAAAFLALYYRDRIPDLLSVNIGNTLIYIGYYLESYVLLSITGEMTTLRKKCFFFMLLFDLVLFNGVVFLGLMPNIRIGVASLIIVTFFLFPALAFLFKKENSPFRRFLGSLLLLIVISFGFRAGMGFRSAQVVLFSNNLIQSVSFMALFLLMLVNGAGFLFLIYESVNEQLRKLATLDSLTQMNNRRSFLEAASAFFLFCKRQELPLSVLFLDIDHFKQTNDDFGHLVGDLVLIHVAEIIGHNIRESDICGRYGGEEFVVLLPSTDDKAGLEVGNRLREQIEASQFPEQPKLHVTISIGLYSAIPGAKDELIHFINRSDKAMYHAKQTGRNRLCVYEEVSEV